MLNYCYISPRQLFNIILAYLACLYNNRIKKMHILQGLSNRLLFSSISSKHNFPKLKHPHIKVPYLFSCIFKYMFTWYIFSVKSIYFILTLYGYLIYFYCHYIVIICYKYNIYFAYTYSKILYGIEVYGSACNVYMKQIQVQQNRSLKILLQKHYNTHT